jgi:hypothetical protein
MRRIEVHGVSSDHLLSSDFKSPTVKIGTGSIMDDPFLTASNARISVTALYESGDDVLFLPDFFDAT